MCCWRCQLAGPPHCPAVGKCGVSLVAVIAAQGHQKHPMDGMNVGMGQGVACRCCGQQGEDIGGGKTFVFDYFPWGYCGLSCCSWAVLPSPGGSDHPTGSCSSVLAGLPGLCCWLQTDLFSLSVLLSARLCLEGDAVLPGLGSLLPCLAGPCSAGLVPWSTGLRAARAPDRPLCGLTSRDGLAVV